MIVRSTNSKFLKYLMDLDMIPIVKVYPSEGSEYISALHYYHEEFHMPPISHVYIHPLTVKEIKEYLKGCTDIISINSNHIN